MDIIYSTVTVVWMMGYLGYQGAHVTGFSVSRFNHQRAFNIPNVASNTNRGDEFQSRFPERRASHNTYTLDRTQHITLNTLLDSFLGQYLETMPYTSDPLNKSPFHALVQQYLTSLQQTRDPLNKASLSALVKDYLTSVQQDAELRPRKRKHRKRSTFDSISHNSGINGFEFSGQLRKKKLPFTFENLLPYLLEMRRNGYQRVQ